MSRTAGRGVGLAAIVTMAFAPSAAASVHVDNRGPKQARVGQTLTYRVTVHNRTRSTLRKAVLHFETATHGQHTSLRVGGRRCTRYRYRINCGAGTLSPGEKERFTVRLRARTTGRYRNDAWVTYRRARAAAFTPKASGAELDPAPTTIRANTAAPHAAPAAAMPNWADLVWDDLSKSGTIETGDVDGDGHDDMIGRGAAGIELYLWDPTFANWRLTGTPTPKTSDPSLFLDVYPGQQGTDWRDTRRSNTIRLANVIPETSGRQKDELFAMTPAGLVVFSYDGKAWVQRPGMSDWNDARLPFSETLQAANIDGLSGDELLMRRDDGLQVRKFNLENNIWTTLPMIEDLATASGYNQVALSSSIGTIDVDGDGRREVRALASTGIAIWSFDLRRGTWARLANVPDAMTNDAYGPDSYRTYGSADLDGVTGEELFFRLDDGLHSWHYDTASGTWQRQGLLTALKRDNGYNQPMYSDTIQAADVDLDARAELISRSSIGVDIYSYDRRTGSWTNLPNRVPWGDAATSTQQGGWSKESAYGTIATAAGNGPDGKAVLYGRGATGIQTLAREGVRWVDPGEDFPQFSGADKVAFDALMVLIKQDGGEGDVRLRYGAQPGQAGTWLDAMAGERDNPRGGADKGSWQRVYDQLRSEFLAIKTVEDWFTLTVKPFQEDLFNNKSAVLQSTATNLVSNIAAEMELDLQRAQLTNEIVQSLLGLVPEIEGPAGYVSKLAETTAEIVGASVLAGYDRNVLENTDRIRGTVGAQAAALNSWYNGVNDAVLTQQWEISRNYGLLMSVGDAIQRNNWQMFPRDPDSGKEGAVELPPASPIAQRRAAINRGAYAYLRNITMAIAREGWYVRISDSVDCPGAGLSAPAPFNKNPNCEYTALNTHGAHSAFNIQAYLARFNGTRKSPGDRKDGRPDLNVRRFLFNATDLEECGMEPGGASALPAFEPSEAPECALGMRQIDMFQGTREWAQVLAWHCWRSFNQDDDCGWEPGRSP